MTRDRHVPPGQTLNMKKGRIPPAFVDWQQKCLSGTPRPEALPIGAWLDSADAHMLRAVADYTNGLAE